MWCLIRRKKGNTNVHHRYYYYSKALYSKRIMRLLFIQKLFPYNFFLPNASHETIIIFEQNTQTPNIHRIYMHHHLLSSSIYSRILVYSYICSAHRYTHSLTRLCFSFAFNSICYSFTFVQTHIYIFSFRFHIHIYCIYLHLIEK